MRIRNFWMFFGYFLLAYSLIDLINGRKLNLKNNHLELGAYEHLWVGINQL
ncbi:hypothetical protein [Maribacter antarcticus]|uniref:hypothetical protein n=1 Tax=Maribacter antarcticus TaxID=505250 RepID=UPI0012EB6D35|nr:hypothetical protein [Maribacter antarcticus]